MSNNLFDQLVDEALENQKSLAPLRIVVEKELLQHDILREMNNAGFLVDLTFIGGTCLRLCYGASRLSEDLDFSTSESFNVEKLALLGRVLVDQLQMKYGLMIKVTEPAHENQSGGSNVSTWKLKVQTRPGHRNLPMQQINIDICMIPSHERKPVLLHNFYGVNMGTAGLVLHAETREEIFADKWIALALRPNRLKYRDLWDISWLHQQGVKLPFALIPLKLQDRACEPKHFLALLNQRNQMLQTDPKLALEFQLEMRRFLPADLVLQTSEQLTFWSYLIQLIDGFCQKINGLFIV